MQQTAENRIRQCLEAMELGDSVLEGIRHLVKHPEASQLTMDTIQAVRSIQGVFAADGKGVLAQLSKALLRPLESGTASAAEIPAAKEWYTELERRGMDEMLRLLNAEPELSGDTSSRLFGRLSNNQIGDGRKAGFLYAVSRCCAATLPRQSYHKMLEAFRTNPQVIRITGRDDSGYRCKPAAQHVFEQCPTCGGEGKPYFNACAFLMSTFHPMFEPAKLWMKCASCGNLYTYRFPKPVLETGKEVKKIVPHVTNDCVGTFAAPNLSIWSRILNQLRKYTQGYDILEIGIGSGELIAVALEMGYRIESVEILEEEAQKTADILGADIWCCDFLKFETDKQYSILTMGDVIEHVTDPEAALRKAHKLLRDGGVLWLSTPNYESSFSRLRKFKDAMWCEPWHISYFNYKGLRVLLEKCGFEVREYAVSNRYNGSMELILTKRQG